MPCRYVYTAGGGRVSVAVAAYSIFCGRLLQVCSSSYDGQYQSLDEWDEQRVRLSRFLFYTPPDTRWRRESAREYGSLIHTPHIHRHRTDSILPPPAEAAGRNLTRNRNWACQTICLHDNPGFAPYIRASLRTPFSYNH